MRTVTRLAPIVALTAALLAAGAHAQSALPAGAVAVVNGHRIAQSALENALRQARANGLADSPVLRQALKSQLIARELFRQQAQKMGLAKDPEVRAIADEARDNAMVQKYLRGAVRPKPVAEADMRSQYDRIVAALGPEEYKARVIQVPDEASAKLLLAELKSGKPFDELARQYSRAPSAKAGGALNWISFKTPPQEGQTQDFPLPLAQAMAGLKAGMVTAEPVAWNNAWYLLKLDEVRATKVPTYEQAQPMLKQMLEQKELERAAAALVAGLIRDAKITQ